MKKRRLMAVGLAAALVALAACDGGQRNTNAEDQITVAAAGGEGEIAALEDVVTAFEAANPGKTVELDTVAEAGELLSKLTAAFAAGTPPDVFVLNYRRLGRFAEQRVIEPVSGVDTSGLYAQPLEAFTFDGELLCLPSNASSMVVYWNPALFSQTEVNPPETGWTWGDMLATARALKQKGVSAIGFETELIRLAPFVWSNGGEIVDDPVNPTVVDLSSPEAREAIQLLLDLQETGQSATDRAAQEPEEAFAAGEIAMYLDSRRAVPGLRGTEDLEFDVAPVPTAGSATSVLHSDGYCVPKDSANQELARSFATFAVTGVGAEILAKSGRTVPMLKSLAESEVFLEADLPPASSQVWLDQLERARALPHTPTWNEAEEAASEVLAQLFAGELTVDQAIDEIATRTELELSRA